MTITGTEHALMATIAVLLESAIRAVLLAAIVGTALIIFRVKDIGRRLSAWTFVLSAALAMPLIGEALPSWHLQIPGVPAAWFRPASADSVPGPSGLGINIGASIARNSSVGSDNSGPTTSTLVNTADQLAPYKSETRGRLPAWSLSRISIVLYLIGLFALGSRAVVGWVATRRLERTTHSVTDPNALAQVERIASTLGVRHPPRLLQSSQVLVPMTLSVVRPAVVVPETWRSWDLAMLHAVLVHEISHVARRDALRHRLSLCYRVVSWFNPLAWWLSRQSSELAEQASDEAVLRAGTNRTHYARMLLEFYRLVPQTGHRAAWHVAMARGAAASAEARVERILSWKGPEAMGLKKLATSGLVIATIAGVSAAASVRPAAVEPPPTVSIAPAQAPNAVSARPAPERAAIAPTAVKVRPARPRVEPIPAKAILSPATQPAEQKPLQTQVPSPTPAPRQIETGFGAGAYRPGGAVSWPKTIQSPKPIYTDDAASAKIQGMVELEAMVLVDGTVGPVRIMKSLDREYGLDNEAIRAVRQWVFQPAQLDGRAVPAVVVVQLEFHLTPELQLRGDKIRLRPLADDFGTGAYTESATQIVPPRPTSEVKPKYTPDGMRGKIMGPVDLEIVVMPDGTVGKARVVRSLNQPSGLDDAALEAAKKWKFLPGTLDGKPVPVVMTLTLMFQLH